VFQNISLLVAQVVFAALYSWLYYSKVLAFSKRTRHNEY
jgi:hypothetical protein